MPAPKRRLRQSSVRRCDAGRCPPRVDLSPSVILGRMQEPCSGLRWFEKPQGRGSGTAWTLMPSNVDGGHRTARAGPGCRAPPGPSSRGGWLQSSRKKPPDRHGLGRVMASLTDHPERSVRHRVRSGEQSPAGGPEAEHRHPARGEPAGPHKIRPFCAMGHGDLHASRSTKYRPPCPILMRAPGQRATWRNDFSVAVAAT
jgi:hypothetical protein